MGKFVKSFMTYSLIITVPIMLGYACMRADRDPAVTTRSHETVSVSSIKDCDTEDGSRADGTYPCKWNPIARGIFIEGDDARVIVFYRVEEGCPDTGAENICVPVPDSADLGPQNVIRWPNGTVEWTTTRGD